MSFIYKGIEFPNEEEMAEYIREVEGPDANVGSLMNRAEGEYRGSYVDKFVGIANDYDTVRAKDRYIIYTLYNGSKLYVSKNNKCTFSRADALITDFETAKQKSFYMSKNGHYKWRYLKI